MGSLGTAIESIGKSLRASADKLTEKIPFLDSVMDMIARDEIEQEIAGEKNEKGFWGKILSSLALKPFFDGFFGKVKEKLSDLKNEIQPVKTESVENIDTVATAKNLFPDMDFDRLNDLSVDILKKKYSKEARVKNNNPSGITRNQGFASANPSSTTTAYWFKKFGVSYEKGAPRPSREGGNYVKFANLETGLNAHIVMREKSAAKGQTIKSRLASWAVDSYDIPQIDMSKTFAELTNEEKSTLIQEQIRIESPGLHKEMQKVMTT